MKILGYARKVWSGTNKRGQLQFKSTFFNVDSVETDPAQACDTFYHARALQPTLLLWQRTGDPEIGEFVTRWMDTWVDASMREENGKPAGIVPCAIHWPDGTVGGLTKEWWKPGNFITALFDWGNGVFMICDTMLLCHEMTQDRKYLAPIFAMAKARREFLAGKLGDPVPEGSLAWAASKLGFLPQILAKYRLVTGDPQFDDLLKADASGYMTMRLTGNRDKMVGDLQQNADAFRVNFPAYTSCTGGGDRVLSGPAYYFSLPFMPQPMPVPIVKALYETATGNPDLGMYFPINAVRWLTPPKDIAALVTDTGKKNFAAELYHFGDKPREMAAELSRLEPGNYTAKLREAGDQGKELSDQKFEVKGLQTRVKIVLPPRKLCLLAVEASKS